MKYLIKIWDWLNGKKTAYGVIGIFIVSGLEALGVISPDFASQLMLFFSGLAGLGAGHKFFKKELL